MVTYVHSQLLCCCLVTDRWCMLNLSQVIDWFFIHLVYPPFWILQHPVKKIRLLQFLFGFLMIFSGSKNINNKKQFNSALTHYSDVPKIDSWTGSKPLPCCSSVHEKEHLPQLSLHPMTAMDTHLRLVTEVFAWWRAFFPLCCNQWRVHSEMHPLSK